MKPPPPDECANCGAEIPRSAKACPQCGADERTGWRETSVYDNLDLPEATSAEDTDATAAPPRRAFQRPRYELKWYWWALAVLLLFLWALGALHM
jgi:hypothetical protein